MPAVPARPAAPAVAAATAASTIKKREDFKNSEEFNEYLKQVARMKFGSVSDSD